MVVISLPGGGQISFDPNGPFAAILPAGSYRGGGSGSASGGGAGLGPGPKPEFQPIDLEALDAAIRASNARRCLTQMGFVCEPVPPSLAGRPNERSTRIAMSWLIDQLGRELRGDVPLPGIVIRANPDPGIVNVPTWFWVDPITYEGQVFSVGASMAAPWTLYWDEVIHHHESVTGPCPTDPTRQCVLGSHDWNETVTHQEEHRDFVEVTVTLTPAQFAWDFGDDMHTWRSESHGAFPNLLGLGRPFTDPYTPSPVLHIFPESSLRVFDEGGFQVRLTATWSVAAAWRFTSDLGDNASGTLALESRIGQYSARHQVRESQPVLRASRP